MGFEICQRFVIIFDSVSAGDSPVAAVLVLQCCCK